MAPKQTRPLTARDLVSKNPSRKVQKIWDLALKHAYEDQQKLLEKAKNL